MDTLELACGVTLHLQPVNAMVLLDFVESGPDNVTQKQFNRMIKYIAGWGVTDDPPDDMEEELLLFGAGEHLQRAAWVRLIATATEIAELMARVMALTQIRMQPPLPAQAGPPEPSSDGMQKRIEELEQQLAEKESGGD